MTIPAEQLIINPLSAILKPTGLSIASRIPCFGFYLARVANTLEAVDGKPRLFRQGQGRIGGISKPGSIYPASQYPSYSATMAGEKIKAEFGDKAEFKSGLCCTISMSGLRN